MYKKTIMSVDRLVSGRSFDRNVTERKRIKISRSISISNQKFISIFVLPLLIAIAFKLIFTSSFTKSIRVSTNITSQSHAVCILDRHTKLAKPISFADCPTIESRSFVKNETSMDSQKDVDLKFQWLFRYLDELTPEFNVMFRETSFDERVSNLNYIKRLIIMFDTDSYKINLGNPQSDDFFKQHSAGNKVNDELCGKQLASMLSQFKELTTIIDEKRKNNQTASSTALEERHIRLARVLESFGRYDSGAFNGRSYFFGSYLQCFGSQMILDNDRLDSKTSSRYCMARLKVDKYLSAQIKSRQPHYLEPEISFATAICLPESCHTKSFGQNKRLIQELIDSQFKLPDWLYLEQSLEVEAIHCGVDRDSYLAKIPFSGWLFILFAISWLGLVSYATVYKYKYSDYLPVGIDTENWFSRSINSLDLMRSWENFKQKKAKDTNDRVQLNVLNPVKVGGCFCVVLIHSGLGVGFTGMSIPQMFNTYERSQMYYISLALMNIIDTFFVISGLMVTYFVVKRYSKQEESKFTTRSTIGEGKVFLQQWFNLTFARYLRLLPAYYLVFWFTKSLFHLIGSGPIWDHGSNRLTMIGGCRLETWFSPIILRPAFSQPNRQCMPQAWTVANDLFLCTFLAPIILLLPKKHKIALPSIVVLSLLSIIGIYVKIHRVPESLLIDMKEIKTDSMARTYILFADIYIAPYFRTVSFLIGSISGYLLYNYNESSEKQWPKWFKGVATKFSWIFIIYIITGGLIYPYLLETPLVTKFKIQHMIFSLYMTLFRLLWCIANAVLFMRMTTDWRHNRLMRAFSGRFWRAMSKLNYGLLLVHLDVIIYVMGTGSTALDYFTINRGIVYISANYFLSGLVALVLHVGFESPVDHFSKLILYPKKKTVGVNELNTLNNSDGKVERILITTGRDATKPGSN